MKSTVYRRGPDGSIVGIPESESRDRRPSGRTKSPSKLKVKKPPILTGSLPKRPSAKTPIPRKNRTARPLSGLGSKLRQSVHLLRAVVIGYLVFYVLLGAWFSSALTKTQATPQKPIADTRGTNWLLVGSDSRKGLTLKEQHQLHTGADEGAQRTDVIMVLHFGSGGSPTLLSLPRDSYVTIPSHVSLDGTNVAKKKNKINAAYSFGGAPLLVATVEANTGLHIDHYMEIGFVGVRDVTNAVKGVNICVPQKYNDKNSGLKVNKGCQVMNGKTALAYVRMRYADPTGDIGRIQRQQQFLAALVHKVATVKVMANPLRMVYVAKAGSDSVIVGSGDGLIDMARLGLAMRSLSGGKANVATVPLSNPDASSPVGSVVLWDKDKAASLFESLGAK
ncbi:MAG: LytR family transcriptional regulator [Actinobacteria bacterium]|uniref:Unannotated protein n=1 Tax=freshwater metagenome TaxID=449393 RepID=A0A6J5Z3Q9_9ZZZZ|nr:LytR family transcriptional regulator [Actinomycetota bacterium]